MCKNNFGTVLKILAGAVLGLDCLQRISVDDTSRPRVNKEHGYISVPESSLRLCFHSASMWFLVS